MDRRRLLLALVVLIAPISAAAQVSNWTGAQSENWYTAANWSPSGVPSTGTNVIVDPLTFTYTDINGGSTANLNAIQIGVDRIGDLLVFNGGHLNNSGVGMLGTNPSGFGGVGVSGSGSRWQMGLGLVVGEQGIGILQISSLGQVSNLQGRIGNLAGSTGSVDVNNGTWTSTNLFVGYAGSGGLDVRSAGFVGNSATAFLGYEATGAGTVRVRSGAQWASLAPVLVGRAGSGTVSVESGATVTSTEARIAVQSGSSGQVTVTGSNSKWTAVGDLTVGLVGSGTLNVLSGGQFESQFAVIGDLNGASGNLTISGAGSRLTASNGLQVGSDGQGLLTVASAGQLISSGGISSIGSLNGAELRVQSGGQWTAGLVRVGLTRAGSLSVIGSGSLVVADSIEVGALGILTGNGDIQALVNVLNNGRIQWATQPTSALDIRNLGLAENAAVRIPLGSAAGFTGPALRIGFAGPGTGNLTLNGRLEVVNAGGFGGAGSYRLMTYSDSLTDNGLVITQIPALQPGLTARIRTSTPGEVWLDIVPASDEIFDDRFES